MPHNSMSEVGSPITPDRPIDVFADRLLEKFGADVCVVVERQIDAAQGTEALATWIAVWERLCQAGARQGKS